ncbi:MAG: sugar transferase [Acidobacteriota bacterium]|nr:sugar transferase [Acidobacteriota bacterium]
MRVCYAAEGFAAALALLALFPLLLFLAIAIWILSRRFPLIVHERVGRYGEPLHMLKFRTMWGSGCEAGRGCGIERVTDSVPGRKSKHDSRVTSRFASLCRRFSLDELPQLLHVLRGEMSLVGPRPLTMVELRTYYGPDAAEILRLRPGLTGLWQLMGRNRLTYAQRRRLDLFLARRASTLLYLRILLFSIPRVLAGSGAW